jgi:hypothetical protein
VRQYGASIIRERNDSKNSRETEMLTEGLRSLIQGGNFR